VRVGDLGALAEQGVGLVEEEDRVRAVGGAEDALEVLLGLPDVLRDDGREIDAVEVQAELGAEHLRAHGLAGAGLAREQDLQPLGPGDGLLVAPVGEDAVAVPEVGGDRAQQHALALGHDEVLPAVRGVQPRGELPERGDRRVTRAAVELRVVWRVAAARARRDPADLGGGADLVEREPELGRDVARVSDAGEVAPRDLALGERRQRDVDDQHGPVAERERLRARVGEDHDPALRLVDRLQQARAVRRREPVEAGDAEQPLLQRGRERRVRHHPGALERGDVEDEQRAGGGGDDRGGVRPADHQGERGVDAEQARDLLHYLVPARDRQPRVDAPQRRRRAGLGEAAARAEQVGREPVGDLHRAVGERDRAVGLEQPQRAGAREPGGDAERRQHVRAVDARALEQVGDEPRAGEPARDVVLQVRVEEAVARVQLGRGADAQHREVERVEAEPLAGLGEARVGVGRRAAVGERERLLVGDVEPAERVLGTVVGRRGGLDGGPQALVEEAEADRGELSRGHAAPQPRRRARARRPAARPSGDLRRARPAAGPCARPRVRSARCRRASRAGTRRARSRCRCRR
jgi:hypothetical protein